VGDAELEVVGREGQDFGVGDGFRGPEDVDVRLVELPESALLDLLVAPERAGREPLDRLFNSWPLSTTIRATVGVSSGVSATWRPPRSSNAYSSSTISSPLLSV
jgi:hypothetical protein